MPHTRTQKTHAKHERPHGNAKHKQQGMETDILIRGLDTLIAMAENSEMGTAARILYTAKEELVHWAVTMNFHESEADRFINHHLYNNRSSTAESLLMRAIKNSKNRNEMLERLGIPAARQLMHASRK